MHACTNCVYMFFSKNAKNNNGKAKEKVITKLYFYIFPHPLGMRLNFPPQPLLPSLYRRSHRQGHVLREPFTP